MQHNPADYRVVYDHHDANGNILTTFDSLDAATAIPGIKDPILARANLLIDGIEYAGESKLLAYVAAHGARTPLRDYFASLNSRGSSENDSLSTEGT